MSVSFIDGRLETAEIKRQTKAVHQYKTLRFALDGGGEHVIPNAVVGNALAERLRPGASGRFYLYKNLDLKGVYGLRDESGALVKAHPQQMKFLYALVPLAWIGVVLFEILNDGTPWLYFIGVILMTVAAAYSFYTERQGDRAIAEDNRAVTPASRRA